MEKNKFLSEKLKQGLREHEVMREHTTIKTGGVADFYFEAKTIDELITAVKAAHEIKIPYVVLGWGSNIVFSDYGFPGLIIKNSTSNISFMNSESQVIVDSGVPLGKLILDETSKNLSGLEFLYGVPGTVGGAVYGNAGAHGASIGDYVKSVTLLMPAEGEEEPKIVQQPAEWMEFGYRSTKLKKIKSQFKPIILTVKLQLAQNRQEEIMRRLKKYQQLRMDSQPAGNSCGSVFKNPIPEELKDYAGQGTSNMPILPKERTAGYMLEKSGAKKLKTANAAVSDKHANFIINRKNATSREIRQLVEEMRNVVKNKFNVELQEEIEYVGQW